MDHADARGARPPTLLFGAFDRHNFGDLLFPHLLAALLPGARLIHAGLAACDLRRHGGHRVQALTAFAAAWGARPLRVIHVGGEVLDCDAWQAALMLQPRRAAAARLAELDARPAAREDWARRTLGVDGRAPYLLPPALLAGAAPVIYNAVGGVGLAGRAPDFRAEVFERLAAASAVGVRDTVTQACLAGSGIAARLMPDPASAVAELFGPSIRRRGRRGAVAALRRALPQGYVAVQIGAEFGDDATLAQLAAGLDRAARRHGCGIALFRAGAAPWHDSAAVLARLAARLRAPTATFASLHAFDVCSLLAGSQGFCGSSLHGRIVAGAFGLPRLNLRSPQAPAGVGKVAAYAASWECDALPAEVTVDRVGEVLPLALAADRARLRAAASALAQRYREDFRALCGGP